jgi:hypothetical protein
MEVAICASWKDVLDDEANKKETPGYYLCFVLIIAYEPFLMSFTNIALHSFNFVLMFVNRRSKRKDKWSKCTWCWIVVWVCMDSDMSLCVAGYWSKCMDSDI